MAQAHNMDHLVLGNINALTLEEGVNYHMIPGKQKNSKLFIKGNFAYKLDKAWQCEVSGLQVSVLHCLAVSRTAFSPHLKAITAAGTRELLQLC